jgi:hypothetical protein
MRRKGKEMAIKIISEEESRHEHKFRYIPFLKHEAGRVTLCLRNQYTGCEWEVFALLEDGRGMAREVPLNVGLQATKSGHLKLVRDE